MADIVRMLQKVVQLHAQRELKQAGDLCHQVLSQVPDQPDAIHFLGVIAYEQNDLETAQKYIQAAIDLVPDNQGCYTNMGNVLQKKKEYSKAVEYYKKTIQMDPRNQLAHNNIGTAYLELGRIDDALASFKQALAINPDNLMAASHVAETIKRLGLYEDALIAFEKIVQRAPDFVKARWNRAILLLLLGDFSRGWTEYEWRWKRPDTPQRMIDAGRPWDGTPFSDKTLFIYEEQGMGDTIQFLRYLPLVKQMGGHIIFEAGSQLLRLVQTAQGVDRLWVGIKNVDTRPTDRFDFSVSLLSIPGLLNTTLETIPNTVPYLLAPKDLVPIWKKRLTSDSAFKVGLVWAGHPDHTNDKMRSIKLSCFQPLFQMKQINWISLQKEKYDKWTDIDPRQHIDQDLGGQVSDFADTAAVIEHLDLVICVDTAVAHLAGAIGKKVWCLLPFCPDWRWMINREDSPWYPTMRLFRQPSPGDWGGVISDVKQALTALLKEK